MKMQGKLRAGGMLAIACGGMLVSGCARMGAMSRVDPLSVAVYPGGESDADNAIDDEGGSNDRGRSSRRRSVTGAVNCRLLAGENSYSRGAINLNCFMFPEDRPGRAAVPSLPAGAIPAAQGRLPHDNPACDTRLNTAGQLAYARAARCERDRNRLTALLLKQSDDVCVEEMGRLNSNESALNTSLSILDTGFTTAANIVTGDLAQAILTGGSTFASSSRSHINAHVFRNTFAYAISRAITLERQRLRALIEARRGQSVTEFTVDEAIRSVNEYHGACSFYKGLELVLASVEGDQRSRDAQARQTQIDAIDQEIRRQEDAMARVDEADRGPYRTSISDLHARRRALVLASVPPPPDPVPPPPDPVVPPPDPDDD